MSALKCPSCNTELLMQDSYWYCPNDDCDLAPEKWEGEGATADLLRAVAELKELRATRDAAIAWWRGKRPFGWTAAEHILKPLVNTRLSTEEDLIRTLFERPK